MSENNKKRCYTLYKHINKNNGKIYIGITKLSPEERWSNGNGYKGQIFGRAIEKYGWDNFEHIIIRKNLTKKEAEDLEVKFIEQYNSTNPKKGYNVAIGGNLPNISKKEMNKRFNKRKREYAIENVICDNIIFNNPKECAGYYRLDYDVLMDWLIGKKDMDSKYIELGLNIFDKTYRYKLCNGMRCVPVICDKRLFKTIRECAEYYNINESTMARWLSGKDKMQKKFIELKLRYVVDNKIKRKNSRLSKKVICNEIIYDSIKMCADFYNIKTWKMGDWLRGKSKMPQEFIELALAYYEN